MSKKSAFTAVKRDTKFYKQYKQLYVEGSPFVTDRRCAKGVPFSSKMVYKRVRGWIFWSFLFVFIVVCKNFFKRFNV